MERPQASEDSPSNVGETSIPNLGILAHLGRRVIKFVSPGKYDYDEEMEAVAERGISAVDFVEETESWETRQYVRSRWGK